MNAGNRGNRKLMSHCQTLRRSLLCRVGGVESTFNAKLEFKQFLHALDLRTADGNCRLLFVVHFQHEGGVKPGKNFLDVMNVDEEGAMRLPERIGIERVAELV